MSNGSAHEGRLEELVLGSSWFMRALRVARSLELGSWCIGAGAVRNLVWDHLHGYSSPTFLADVDLAYFDPDEAWGVEREHQSKIMRAGGESNSPTAARLAAGPRRSGPEQASDTANSPGGEADPARDNWEVTNQAHVHLWFEAHFGHAVPPLRSLSEAVASWPEFATSVGVTLGRDDTIGVIAPWGLDDLFAMQVRRNPARVSVDTFRARVANKRYTERWPKVVVISDD